MPPTNDKDFWRPGVELMREATANARETIVFLHLAKSGGSTITRAFAQSKRWERVKFPYASPTDSEPHTNWRGRPVVAPWLTDARRAARRVNAATGIFIVGGHPPFEHVSWVARELGLNRPNLRIVTVFRSARARIVSRFRDYWAHAATVQLSDREIARINRAGERRQLEEFRRDIDEFHRDSLNYRDASGRIDGRRWFRDVFTSPSFPFLFNEVFGSPETLRSALSSQKLEVVELEKLDAFLREMTGTSPRRVRVSPGTPREVAVAIDESADIIQRMVDSDAEYEQIFRDYLAQKL